MGKNKNKKKKINAKKEKYSKFRKDKPTSMTFAVPDLTPEQRMQKQQDERNIDYFLRYSRNPPTQEISERKMRSKR